MGTPTSKKKKKQEKKNLSQPLPKPNRPIKTATLFKQDDNRAWTQMFGNRFGSIKAVAMKRAPTTKPLVVNPVPKNSKHAQVLSESGISYDAPLNPISVAANRAERIQKELNPLGVGVVLKAQHLCMAMRGVKKHDVYTTTSKMIGAFKEDMNTRHEFLKLIKT